LEEGIAGEPREVEENQRQRQTTVLITATEGWQRPAETVGRGELFGNGNHEVLKISCSSTFHIILSFVNSRIIVEKNMNSVPRDVRDSSELQLITPKLTATGTPFRLCPQALAFITLLVLILLVIFLILFL
jgi:hypothetical protein